MAVKSETEKLSELDDLFSFILKIQERVATPEETRDGEGRKGVLMIRGSESKWVKIFEVCGGRLVEKSGVEDARTVIVFEGVDVFRNLIQDLLDGKPGAFSRARAKGDIKVVGEHAIRDLAAFNRLFSSVGKVLVNYGVKVGG